MDLGYALLIFEKNVEMNKLPPKVQPLLDEFTDVVPKEIPLVLPPIRDIVMLPNKVAYRMSYIEHIKLQRQVNELILKGLVKESRSLCVVPSLLIPNKDGLQRMCINSQVVNKISISYQFPILWLNDLLYELNGATTF